MVAEVRLFGGPTVAQDARYKSLDYAELHVMVGKNEHLRAVRLTEAQLVELIEKSAQCLRRLALAKKDKEK